MPEPKSPTKDGIVASKPTMAVLNPQQPAEAVQVSLGSTNPQALSIPELRNALWKSAYDKLQKDESDLMKAYDKLVKNVNQQSRVGTDQVTNAADLTSDDIFSAAKTEKSKMESKQWSFSWFGKPQKVRNIVESILTIVQTSSELISAGVEMAPPFVSLPWSMVTILIDLVLKDFEATKEAIDGIKEITSILASYNLAENEYLPRKETNSIFSKEVMGLYVSIFKYQASVSIYFTKSTFARLRSNIIAEKHSWQQALNEVKNERDKTYISLQSLGTHITLLKLKKLEDMTQSILQSMNDSLQQARAQTLNRQQVVEWISPINVFLDHLDVRQSLGGDYSNTGHWLLNDNVEFRDWKSSGNGAILLQGAVGSGKSCLTSIVVQDFLENSQQPLAFFYCSSGSLNLSHPRATGSVSISIIRCLLAQYATMPDGSIAEPLQSLFNGSEKQGKGDCDSTLEAIISLFLEVLELQPKAQFTLIIDALDECTDYYKLLESIKEIVSCDADVRIFITARLDIEIHPPLSISPKLIVNESNSVDINAYIEKEVSKRYSGSGMTEEQAKRLTELLQKNSEGIFRWVVLELDKFLPLSPRQGRRQQMEDIDARLDNIASSNAKGFEKLLDSYKGIYADALGNDDEERRAAIVKSSIKWCLCSFRPLSSRELSLAICIKLLSEDYAKSSRGAQSSKPANRQLNLSLLAEKEDDILSYCSNILTKNSRGEIKIFHLSVRQFFESRMADEFSPEKQHIEIADLLARLEIVRLFSDTPTSFDAIRKLRSQATDHCEPVSSFFLVDYVQNFWSLHCKAATETKEITALLNLPQWESKRSIPAISLQLDIAKKRDLADQNILGDTWFHRIIRCNLPELVILLVRVDRRMEDSRLASIQNKAQDLPLHLAALHGSRTSLTALVIDRADDQVENAYGLKPLQLAIVFGRDDIIKRALRMGLDLGIKDSSRNGLSYYAETYGRIESLQTLAMAGADISTLKPRDSAKSIPFLAMRTTWMFEMAEKSTTDVLPDNSSPSVSIRGDGTVPESPHNIAFGLAQNPVYKNRSKVIIRYDKSSSCTTCDLQTWIEGSREGLQYPVNFLNLGRTERMCGLCSEIKKCIPMDGNVSPGQDISEDPQIKVWVALDNDSPVRTGQDLLRINTYGHEIVDLELCIRIKGQWLAF
jgi:N-terminal domain of NWD NACHT-NTPase